VRKVSYKVALTPTSIMVLIWRVWPLSWDLRHPCFVLNISWVNNQANLVSECNCTPPTHVIRSIHMGISCSIPIVWSSRVPKSKTSIVKRNFHKIKYLTCASHCFSTFEYGLYILCCRTMKLYSQLDPAPTNRESFKPPVYWPIKQDRFRIQSISWDT
jgi:hypothetical protein